MVDDGAPGPVHTWGRRLSDRAPAPVPCVARPGTGLFHVEGKCECFFGGPPPVFRDIVRVPAPR